MSLIVKAALLESRTLPKNEGRVLLAIAAHTNRAGDAWPSVATIAEYAGCSERTVQRCIPKLIKLGKLVVAKVAGIVTRVYRLILGGGANQHEGVPSDDRTRQTSPRGGATDNGSASPEGSEGNLKKKPRASAREWFARRGKNTNPGAGGYPYPERRGAALPPPPGGDRCQKPGHNGQIVGRCTPCRSEEVGVR
ncbi:helix-turn-helix domain-containing protein [Micromonospora sp. NPDC020750]|uniref:helix-turn-helix domain-containing protein n=1 Tax=unclassified Micromonospora TaxID=2617518 RepID=UPI0037BDB0B7